MYTLEDSVTAIIQTLRMPSISSAEITSYINQCYDYISSQVLLTQLESSGVVDTVPGSLSVPIPSTWNYHRNLFSCEVANNGPITLLNSREHLRRIYSDFDTVLQTGPIQYVVISGASILYYPVPAEAVELVCFFYQKPESLEVPISGYSCGEDLPGAILLGLQPKVIESYVCWQIWARVEDGIEGRKVNTAYYLGQFKEAMVELEDSTEVGQSRKLVYRSSSWI